MSSDGDLGEGQGIDTASLLSASSAIDDARALAAARTGAATSSGSGNEYEETLLSPEAMAALKKSGGGILGTTSYDSNSKFRWDKPSRLIRMQHGTTCYRFTLLFLSVIIVFSGYFQFDLPAITVNYLLPKLNIGMAEYSSIFVGYSVSNTIVPLLSGPFFSRFGKWRGVTVIAITITIGIATVWAGMLASNFPLVVLGRTIYGLGGESVFVGVDILVTKWFLGAEIGFAYGLIQAAGQAGSFTALYGVPPLLAWLAYNVNGVYLTSLILSCVALACLALARLIEKTAYGRPKKNKSTAVSATPDGDGNLHNDPSLQYTAAGGFAAAVMDSVVAARAKEEKAKHQHLGAEEKGLTAPGGDDEEEEEEEEEAVDEAAAAELQARLEHNLRFFKCVPPLYHALQFVGIGHLVSLSWRFFAVMGGIICYSSAFYTFLAFGPKWLMTVHHLGDEEAGQTAGIIAIFSMVVSPTIGLVMDKRGGQRYVCFGAMVSACVWFTVMGFTSAPPVLCIIAAGMSYSLLPASLYPLLPEFVPDESFTIVYAVLNSAINLVFTIVLLIAGQVLGEDTTELAAVGPHGVLLTSAMRMLGGGASSNSSGMLGNGGGGGDVDPVRFNYVFAMFIAITAFGSCVTGTLAYDGYANGTGWQPLKGGHGH